MDTSHVGHTGHTVWMNFATFFSENCTCASASLIDRPLICDIAKVIVSKRLAVHTTRQSPFWQRGSA